MNLEEQAAERKARIAALREQRKKTNELAISTGNNLTSNVHPVVNIVKNETDLLNTEKNEPNKSYTNGNIEDDVSASSERPLLRISASETVEAIAEKEQQRIFAQFHRRALEASLHETEVVKVDRMRCNVDLKEDLALYFEEAKEKTDQAIRKILLEKTST